MVYPTSHKPSFNDESDGEDNFQDVPTDEASASALQKVRLLASRAKRKVRELPDRAASRGDEQTLKIVNGERDDDTGDVSLSDDPAFNPGPILDGSLKGRPRKPSDSGAGKLKQAGNAIIHPRRAMREKTTRVTASKISKSQRPYLSPEQDLELLRADDELAEADSSSSSIYHGEGITESNSRQAARARLQNVQQNRESLKTGWIIGKHVVRVRAVSKPPTQRPRRQQSVTITSSHQQRLEWEKWLGHLLLWHTRNFTTQYIDDFGERPPFDVHGLARTVERLALVSAPWQSFFLEVRRVYTWNDKKQSSKWCALFWFLWYTDHIVGFLYAYIIYTTIRNWFYPTSIDSVRKTMARGIDRERKAQAWGELIEKHGKSDWVEPLITDMGPLIQMQLGDLTNFIEVMLNFYRWERPSKTAGTLFYYFCCLLVTLLADTRFCVRLVWWIIGAGFFFCWPLATRFPQYRILLDPVRWVFWDIPTHAELGFIQLQEKAILKDAKDLDEAIAVDYDDTASNSDYHSADEELSRSPVGREIAIRAYSGKHRGRLTLSRDSLTFSSVTGLTVTTSLASIIEMRKIPIDGKAERLLTFQSQTESLEFDFRQKDSSETETLSILVRSSDQHRVFNHVLAWSGLKWQSLHIKRHPAVAEGKKEIDKAIKNIVHGKG